MNRRGRRAAALSGFAITLAVFVAGCGSASSSKGDRGLIPSAFPTATSSNSATATRTPRPGPVADPTPGVVETSGIPILNIPIGEWRLTNFRRHVASVDPQDLLAAAGGRNSIQPIYTPRFTTVAQAATLKWLTPDHPVAVLEVNGDARAYPLGMLTIHEVVNDTVGGEAVLVTYCPLCYTAMAFNRTLDGRVLSFGTTGVLLDSNLVMWDDATESWWQQVTGQAVIGDLAGIILEPRPMFIVPFSEFARTFPTGTVLSPESTPTYYDGAYGLTPYVNYDGPNNRPPFFFGRTDPRLDSVERVLGVTMNGSATSFPFSRLRAVSVVNTTVGGQPVVVLWQRGTRSALDLEAIAESRDVGSAAAFNPTLEDGTTLTFRYEDGRFRDAETGSTWSLLGRALDGPLTGTQLKPVSGQNSLWFSWADIHPETEIFQAG
ncbi:MAG: DUF3179 domain-containing protein [Chloroflexi bacterium]|nr:DUF3179 domain-containing protein [Chloroflexota bacterium]